MRATVDKDENFIKSQAGWQAGLPLSFSLICERIAFLPPRFAALVSGHRCSMGNHTSPRVNLAFLFCNCKICVNLCG